MEVGVGGRNVCMRDAMKVRDGRSEGGEVKSRRRSELRPRLYGVGREVG